jgi:hypothetical protein
VGDISPEALLRARVHLTIVNHIPGRIRIRFEPALLKLLPELANADGKDFLRSLDGLERRASMRMRTASLYIMTNHAYRRHCGRS